MNILQKIKYHFDHFNDCPKCGINEWKNDHSTGNYNHEKTCKYCRYILHYEVTPY